MDVEAWVDGITREERSPATPAVPAATRRTSLPVWLWALKTQRRHLDQISTVYNISYTTIFSDTHDQRQGVDTRQIDTDGKLNDPKESSIDEETKRGEEIDDQNADMKNDRPSKNNDEIDTAKFLNEENVDIQIRHLTSEGNFKDVEDALTQIDILMENVKVTFNPLARDVTDLAQDAEGRVASIVTGCYVSKASDGRTFLIGRNADDIHIAYLNLQAAISSESMTSDTAGERDSTIGGHSKNSSIILRTNELLIDTFLWIYVSRVHPGKIKMATPGYYVKTEDWDARIRVELTPRHGDREGAFRRLAKVISMYDGKVGHRVLCIEESQVRKVDAFIRHDKFKDGVVHRENLTVYIIGLDSELSKIQKKLQQSIHLYMLQ